MHRSASFARARFTITKSDWPAINLGRNLCRWASHDGTYSYVKELERSGNAWRPAHAAQRRLNALGGTRSLLSKPSNGTPRPVRGVLLFYSTVHPPYGHPPYGVPWSARLIRGPGGRLWLRRTAPQPNPQREANQLAASWRPLDLAGQPRLRSAASKTSRCRSAG